MFDFGASQQYKNITYTGFFKRTAYFNGRVYNVSCGPCCYCWRCKIKDFFGKKDRWEGKRNEADGLWGMP